MSTSRTENCGPVVSEREAALLPKRPLARVVGEALVDAGVTQFFGVLGSGNLEMVAHAVSEGAAFLHSRHENGAMMMAAAYTEVSGRTAVCAVHQGPGMTNALTGLVEAAKRGLPAILLAACTARNAPRRNFYIDQERLAVDCGADVLNVDVQTPVDVAQQIHDSIRKARELACPLLINVPVGDLDCPVLENRQRDHGLAGWTPVHPKLDELALGEAVVAIERARHPVVLVGHGAAISPGGIDESLKLAERLRAPAGTTALANGATTGYPHDLGIVGGFSHPDAAHIMREADVVIAVGTSLTPWTTQGGSLFAPNAVLVHISTTEPDPSHGHEYIPLRGDAATTVAELARLLPTHPAQREEWRLDKPGTKRSERWDDRHYNDVSRPGRLDPRSVARELQRILPERKTLVLDGGDNVGYGTLYMKAAQDGRSFIFTCAGFQSIGLGIPAGVGAAQARPDHLTVISLGDCGALMAASEIDTIARSPVSMLVVVYNDAAAGAEVHHFRSNEIGVQLARFPLVHFGAVAAAYGLESTTVNDLADLEEVTKWLDGPRTKSLVLDVRIDPDVVLDWAAEAFL